VFTCSPKAGSPATRCSTNNNTRSQQQQHQPTTTQQQHIMRAQQQPRGPPPTQEQLNARLTEALRGLIDNAPPEQIDRTYEKIIEHYCAWVGLQLANNVIPAPADALYSTPAVVELYFAQVVGYRDDVQPNTAKRTMYGIQKLADRERVGLPERWELKSSTNSRGA
jgi:hypothetical protein